MFKKLYLSLTLLTALLCFGAGNAWGAQSLPYDYGFENYSLATDGWTKQNPSNKNNGEFVIAGSGVQRTGSYGFRFSSYDDMGDNTQYLISPELDGATGVIFQFYYKASSSSTSGEKFKVGYSTTDTDIASFTFGDEVNAKNTSWLQYNSDKSIEFPAGTKYIAIYYYANYQYRLYTDDYHFEAGTDVPVSGPALSVYDGSTKLTSGANCSLGLATAGTTKTFTLKNPGTAATPVSIAHTGSFGVSLSAASIPAGEEITLTVTMPAASGSDVVTISSTAEGVDDFVINVSGTAKDPTRVFETLLDGSKPTDWTTSGTWYWDATKGAYNTAYYESYGYRVITPLLTVAEGETFYFDAKGTYEGYQGVKFEYSADGTTWTASSTTTTVSSDWQTFMINDVPAGKYYIALHGWQVQLRNYYGGYIPAAPKNIVLTEKNTTSLTLDWTPAGTETSWVLQYSTDNATWSSDVAVNEKPFELTGLNPSTKYYVRVRNAATSDWSAVADFRTECAAISTLPWNYGFEDDAANAAPACWQLITYYDDWDAVYYPYVAASGAYAGSKVLYFVGGGSAATSPVAILPQFEDPISTLALTFYYKNSSTYASYAQLKVGYMTDPSDASTFTAVEALEKTTTYTKVGPYIFTDAPANAYFAIQYAGGSSDYGAAYVDNVVVEEAPSCILPSGLNASSVTDEGATLSWTAGGSETAWVLQYKRYDGDWSADINVTTASYTLTGLDANTNYYVRVKALCGGEDVSDWTNSLNFKTTCGVSAMPFEEDFGSTSAIPDCWTVGKTGGSYQWAPTYDTYPNYYLYFRTGSGSTYSYLTLPAIALTEDAQLTFDWRNSNNVTADLLISTDGGVTFTSIPNHGLSTTASSWTTKKYDLSAYTGETVIISIQGYNGTSNRYLRIDNIRVEAKPCEALAAPTAVPTVDGGTITWTGNAKALRYQAAGASTWNTVSVSANSYLLTGLEASTSYNVQVQTACAEGEDDLWSASLTFTTRCAALDVLPYSNNFDAEESSEMPACWSKISTTAYPYVYSGSAAYGGTGKFLYFQGNTEQIAVLPALTADMSTLTLSLYYKGSNATFQLGYVEADGVNFHPLETLPILTAYAENPYELDMADAPAEAKYIAIRYTNTSSYGAGYVDNVVVAKTPTCFKPASIASATGVTSTNATIAWTASGKGETQYQYICVPAGGTPDWNAAELTNELSATLTTLAPTTEYTFYVRSYCGTDDQSNAVSTSFTTKCAAAALPFDEDFDAVADYDMPACWNVYAATYYAAYVANGQLQADAPKTNATVIVLPELEDSFVGLSISFKYRTDNGTLEVGYVTDAADKNSFVPVSEALAANSTTQAIVPFTAGSGNIALSFIGNTGDGSLYLDDIRISRLEVFSDSEDTNQDRLAALKTAGTIDVIINRNFPMTGDYNTLCLPFSLSAAQLADAECPLNNFKLKVFDYATVLNQGTEDEEVQLAIAPASSIEAGVPYFVAYLGESTTAQTSMLFKNVVIEASEPDYKLDNGVKYTGVFNPATLEKDNEDLLFLAAGNKLYWPSASNDKIVNGFRCYFNTNAGASSAPVRRGVRVSLVERAAMPTGIENTNVENITLKFIENGQVIIIRNGVKYNIQGQVIQ